MNVSRQAEQDVPVPDQVPEQLHQVLTVPEQLIQVHTVPDQALTQEQQVLTVPEQLIQVHVHEQQVLTVPEQLIQVLTVPEQEQEQEQALAQEQEQEQAQEQEQEQEQEQVHVVPEQIQQDVHAAPEQLIQVPEQVDEQAEQLIQVPEQVVQVVEQVEQVVPVPVQVPVVWDQLLQVPAQVLVVPEPVMEVPIIVSNPPVNNVFNQGQILSDEEGQVVIQEATATAAASGTLSATAGTLSAGPIIIPDVIPPPGVNIAQIPIQVPAIPEIPELPELSVSKQWVPEPDGFMYFSEISSSNVSEKKVLNAWNNQAIEVGKSILDNIMLHQIEKSFGVYVRAQSEDRGNMKEFNVSDYVSVNIDALLQVGGIIPPYVADWWKGYFKKVYDDFHNVAKSCYNRDVMFQEQLKAYAENMRTLLVITSCNTVNAQVQSAVMQMREIIQTAKDTQKAAVVLIASRTRELAYLQQKIKGIRLTQQAASIFPEYMFKTYQTVADLLPDGDIWDVMKSASASEIATAAWEEATSSSSWSGELLEGYIINHSNIMKIEDEMLLSDIEIYALLATAAASPRICNGRKVVVLPYMTVRDAYMRYSNSDLGSNSKGSSSQMKGNSSSKMKDGSPFSPSVTAKLIDTDAVLFAVNTDTYGGGIHWVLGVVEPKQSRFIMFDSMESVTDISHLQSIREAFQVVYQKKLGLEKVALDQQYDELSCGYHVVINGIRYIHYNNINYCSDEQSRKLTKVMARIMVGFWCEKRMPEDVNVFEQLVVRLMDTAKEQLEAKIPAAIIKDLDDEADILLDTESKMESLFSWMISQLKTSQLDSGAGSEPMGSGSEQLTVVPTPSVAAQPLRRKR
jgi:hypothetical protein